jgi:CoA-transferase family III
MSLSGLRVVDLTRILAGPFCSMLLADIGEEGGQGRNRRRRAGSARAWCCPRHAKTPARSGRQAGVDVAKSFFALGIKPS